MTQFGNIIIKHWELYADRKLYCNRCGRETVAVGIKDESNERKYDTDTGALRIDFSMVKKCPKRTFWDELRISGEHSKFSGSIKVDDVVIFKSESEADLFMLGQ